MLHATFAKNQYTLSSHYQLVQGSKTSYVLRKYE